MPLDLDTSLLRTLRAVGDTNNFSRAATQLNITQSAVTLRIQRLEHAVRKSLVHRSRTGVSLTEDGRVLADYARRILELNDQAIEHVFKKNAREVIAVGVIEEFERFYLEEFLKSFHQVFPRVRIDVVVDYSRNLKRQLDEDKIRLAVLKKDVASGQVIPLYSDPLVWVASTTMLWMPGRPVPLVVSPEPCINRAAMVHALDLAGLTWSITSSCPTLSGVVAAVKAGLGISAIDLNSVLPGMRILSGADGFPDLPASSIAILHRSSQPDRLLSGLVRQLQCFVASKSAARAPAQMQVPVHM
jgi:DNA-binding transcriptional LysR family regulator